MSNLGDTGAEPPEWADRSNTSGYETWQNSWSDVDRATDDYGLCVVCGGHGATIRDADPRVDVLTDREQARLARGGMVLRGVPCRWCDGQDRATPLMESRAESADR